MVMIVVYFPEILFFLFYFYFCSLVHLICKRTTSYSRGGETEKSDMLINGGFS